MINIPSVFRALRTSINSWAGCTQPGCHNDVHMATTQLGNHPEPLS
jgi:hypothetical protein